MSRDYLLVQHRFAHLIGVHEESISRHVDVFSSGYCLHLVRRLEHNRVCYVNGISVADKNGMYQAATAYTIFDYERILDTAQIQRNQLKSFSRFEPIRKLAKANAQTDQA